jgi:hypothetical protein
MEKKYRRFLVSYSYGVYNQSYDCIANDEIVLKNEEITGEIDIPMLLKDKIQNIKRGSEYAVKNLVNFWEIRDK